ncbi:MAG: ATP-dependent DNA helicase Rep [Phycisphaerae bacterium]|nr:ATP-dependent DNA helicase Rep [Phycisphaerae bacterium]
MDSIEVGRQKAERLHKDGVAYGHNPWEPYGFVCAEAARRDLIVEEVAKGDVRLYGGRAVYDADSLLIIHEQSGDRFTDAFLVAHEIGHAEFGGGEAPSQATKIDPLQASEAVPLGVDRVVDYSHRQRREVLMNVFAREFLLPRSWMRDLHLDERLTAAEIASKCGAPHAVVAQQLLDALLLPPIVIPEESQVANLPLTTDQSAAAEHDGTPLLLEAGPGTGKTKTLVGRIEYLISKGVDPASILVLTFSNKAAGELSERIAARHPQAVASMWIGTFHGFGLDIIRRFHDRLGLPRDPRLIDRTDAIGLLEDEYPRLGLKHFKDLQDPTGNLAEILAAISRAHDEVVDANAYRKLAEVMLTRAGDDRERLQSECHLEVAKVFAAYEKLKLDAGSIDFGDLVALPVRLLETHEDVRAHLASRYKHILVDEFQDVNRSSVRLLKALAGNGRNLWVVGDVKQSIYRFRGASSFNVARFGREDFGGGERRRLTRNYRSVKEIVDVFSTFAAVMPSSKDSEVGLDADRGPSGYEAEYRSVDFVDDEITAVAETIHNMREAGYRYRDQAILSAGNERLTRFADHLEHLGIPVLYLGSLFERDEVKDLLSLLSIIIDRRPMGLLRVAALRGYATPLSDVVNFLAYVRELDCGPMKWYAALDNAPDLSGPGRSALRRIGDLLNGFLPGSNPWDVLATVLLDRTRMAAEFAVAPDVRSKSQALAIWQLMNFLRVQPSAPGLPIYRVLERIRRLVLLADERDLRQLPIAAQGIDAVRLMTMHGSKGLEFSVVHIPGLNEGSLPRSAAAMVAHGISPPDGMIEGAEGKGTDAVKAALLEEQECLCYVALSRARDRLFLYSPTKKSNGHRCARSSFIDRLAGHLQVQHIRPALSINALEENAVPITFEGRVVYTDRQLSLYERCPRRFLYTHVLELGGRRRETAFMKLHVAVQKVVDAMRNREALTTDQLKALFEETWVAAGPVDHGYRDEYKSIAWQLIRFYVESVGDMRVQPSEELRLAVDGGEVVVTPDQQLAGASGQIVMRRVNTGHKHSKEDEKLAAAAFQLAATMHRPGCRVELVHLSDATVTPVSLSAQKLANRRQSLSDVSRAVGAGHFPAKAEITCPRCPSFFICGRLPEGSFTKKILA